MPKPKLRAEFFVSADGVVVPKAPSLDFHTRKCIWERDGKKCQLCDVETSLFKIQGQGSPFNKTGLEESNIDHIFPRSRGGHNIEENLRLLCLRCNMAKGAK